jgi:hypothetical protein
MKFRLVISKEVGLEANAEESDYVSVPYGHSAGHNLKDR